MSDFAMIENKNTGHTGPYSIVKGKNVVVAKAVLVEIRELEALIKYEGIIQRCGAAGHTFTAPDDDSTKPKPSHCIPYMPRNRETAVGLNKRSYTTAAPFRCGLA